uniref:Alternative protein HIVEP1 n=1 Tax=Homo sapiens TaxID=9606 RepID=L8EC93_HUMAN|nr:alternative protein HIVEP1 [Homo sapiens]
MYSYRPNPRARPSEPKYPRLAVTPLVKHGNRQYCRPSQYKYGPTSPSTRTGSECCRTAGSDCKPFITKQPRPSGTHSRSPDLEHSIAHLNPLSQSSSR